MQQLRNTNHMIDQNEIKAHTFYLKKYPPLSLEEEKRTVERILNGDKKAKDELILSNLRFVITIAKRHQHQGLSLNDLISEGNYGLIKAAEKYDYKGERLKPGEPQVRFLTYAVWWIQQSIKQALCRDSRVIRLPVNVVNDIFKSSSQPLSETTFDYSLNFPKVMSLDGSVDDEGNPLYELVKDEKISTPYEVLDNPTSNVKSSLHKILGLLNDKEKYVMTKAFGLDGGEPWTLNDIADRLDLTKERVRQIKEKSLKKVRNSSYELLKLIA